MVVMSYTVDLPVMPRLDSFVVGGASYVMFALPAYNTPAVYGALKHRVISYSGMLLPDNVRTRCLPAKCGLIEHRYIFNTLCFPGVSNWSRMTNAPQQLSSGTCALISAAYGNHAVFADHASAQCVFASGRSVGSWARPFRSLAERARE